MKLGVKEVEDVVVLMPHGKLMGGKETDALRDKVQALDGQGNMKLLINLGGVDFMSSLGLSILFIAHAKYAKRGACVKLCCVDKRIHQIFVIVKLTLVYGENIHQTEEEALASFRTMKLQTA